MDWLNNLISTAGQVQVARNQAKVAQYQQLGDGGYYVEGQPGVTQSSGLVLPTGMVLIAGGVLLIMLLMKD